MGFLIAGVLIFAAGTVWGAGLILAGKQRGDCSCKDKK